MFYSVSNVVNFSSQSALFIISSDGASNDVSAGSAGFAERALRRDKNVRNILILAKKGQVHHNFKRLCVSSHNDDFGNTSVERLSGLIGSLLQLTLLGSLSDEGLDFDGQIVVGKGCCSALVFFVHLLINSQRIVIL